MKMLLSARKMDNITDIFETRSINLVICTAGLCQTHYGCSQHFSPEVYKITHSPSTAPCGNRPVDYRRGAEHRPASLQENAR
jgi:hypothetical protein